MSLEDGTLTLMTGGQGEDLAWSLPQSKHWGGKGAGGQVRRHLGAPRAVLYGRQIPRPAVEAPSSCPGSDTTWPSGRGQSLSFSGLTSLFWKRESVRNGLWGLCPALIVWVRGCGEGSHRSRSSRWRSLSAGGSPTGVPWGWSGSPIYEGPQQGSSACTEEAIPKDAPPQQAASGWPQVPRPEGRKGTGKKDHHKRGQHSTSHCH